MKVAHLKTWLIAASLTTAGSCAWAAPLAYVVDSDTPNPSGSALYQLDLATGQSTQRGPIASVFADIESLTLDSAGRLLGIDDATKTLIQIDLQNGATASVSSLRGNLSSALPPSGGDPSLAFTCDGQLIAATVTGRLFKLDPNAGSPIQIGSGTTLPLKITDLAVRGNDLYGLGEDRLYRIDISNGTAKGVGTFGGALFSSGGGLSFDVDGTLWAISDRGDANSLIYRIDPTSGTPTPVGSTPIKGIESLAIAPTQCPAVSEIPPLQIPASSRQNLAVLVLLLGGMGLWRLLRRN